MAAGERRGGLRDRAAAAVRAAGRPDAVQATATWWRAPSPTSTARSSQEFPPECRDADYEKRIKAAYPIHPEIFDRLYTDWSTLVKFQRTRGVLRLMAAVIHSLWEKGDRNPADPAGEHPDRRSARAVRADALSLRQLGAGDREGRGRPQLAAAAARRRGAEPRQVRRLPARGAHDLPRLGAHADGRPPRASRIAGSSSAA